MSAGTLFVRPKDDAHRASLIAEYESMGYYVSVVDDRLRVSSKPAPKASVKKFRPRKPRDDRND